MIKIYIYLLTLFLLISCSSNNLITNEITESNKEIQISSFEFNFPESKTISTESIIDSGKHHFFYFFSPTWGHCVSELQKLDSELKAFSSTMFFAVSIDPTMNEDEFDSFRIKNNLDDLQILPYNKDMLLHFDIKIRGSKRIIDMDSKLVYSGSMTDYDSELWENLLND